MSDSPSTVRTAIITGGSGGIGRAAAERLARDGLNVVVHYAGNKAKAVDTVQAILGAGGHAVAVGGDVADEAAMTRLFDQALTSFGGIDVLVHAAGVMRLATIIDMDLETFDSIQRTNVRGTFVVNQLAARTLRPGGAIINVSTSQTRLQHPTYGAYAASKSAVEALGLILARELRGRDITVNTIAPGPTATPLFLDGKTPEAIANIASLSPMERLGTGEDLAKVVSFLAGRGRWINGQTIYTNGGAV